MNEKLRIYLHPDSLPNGNAPSRDKSTEEIKAICDKMEEYPHWEAVEKDLENLTSEEVAIWSLSKLVRFLDVSISEIDEQLFNTNEFDWCFSSFLSDLKKIELDEETRNYIRYEFAPFIDRLSRQTSRGPATNHFIKDNYYK